MPTRKKQKATAPKAHAVAPPPERKHHTPPWKRTYLGTMSSTVHSVSSWLELMEEGRIRIPEFQRPWVWTDEQVRRFLESIVRGYHVGNLLLWRRNEAPAWEGNLGEMRVCSPELSALHGSYLVVDGQQRLGALATASVAERFKFDLRDGSVHVEERDVPWLVPFSLLMTTKGMLRIVDGAGAEHAARHGLDPDEVKDYLCEAMALVSGSWALSAVEIPERWELSRVMESFRRINTEGTPMDPDMLRAALERATAREADR